MSIEDGCGGADKIKVEAAGDPGTTGRFEVTVAGELIISKATKGHGKCESQSEKDMVIAAVNAALAK